MTHVIMTLLAQPVAFFSELAMFLFLPTIAAMLVALIRADRMA